MKILTEGLGGIAALVLIIWVAAIYSAQPQQRAVLSCKPVHYSMNGAARLYVVLTGQPDEAAATLTWPDEARLTCLRTMNRLYGVD